MKHSLPRLGWQGPAQVEAVYGERISTKVTPTKFRALAWPNPFLPDLPFQPTLQWKGVCRKSWAG